MLQRLGFDEDELDDMVFEEEQDVPKERVKWLALARVHTMNYFSTKIFEQPMMTTWSPSREVKYSSFGRLDEG
jgi:hypothetical protein